MFVLSYVNVLCIYPRLSSSSQFRQPTWQTSMLYPDIDHLLYVNNTILVVGCPSTRFKSIVLWPGMNYQVPFWVLRHSFLSLADCLWLCNIQLKTSRGVLFLHPSDAYVRSLLCLLYTLIKLYYTKALSDPALSLTPDWIRLLRRPRRCLIVQQQSFIINSQKMEAMCSWMNELIIKKKWYNMQ